MEKAEDSGGGAEVSVASKPTLSGMVVGNTQADRMRNRLNNRIKIRTLLRFIVHTFLIFFKTFNLLQLFD